MSVYSTYAWLALGVSVVASTAHASIPDANGVIHGCYNALTGSARIVDGTNCGLLEKAVSWQQTGPQGPAGNSVSGASLNVGDSHCPAGGVALTLSGTTNYICNGSPGAADIAMGTGSLNILPPIAPVRTNHAVIEDKSFTAAQNGLCIVTAAGTQLEATPTLWFQIVAERDDGQAVYGYQHATLQVTDYSLFEGGFASAMMMDGFDVQAGHTYHFGVNLVSEPDPVTDAKLVGFRLSWICKYGPDAT